jgi:hypothetical protein
VEICEDLPRPFFVFKDSGVGPKPLESIVRIEINLLWSWKWMIESSKPYEEGSSEDQEVGDS